VLRGWLADTARRAGRGDSITRGWAVVTGGSAGRLLLGFVSSVLLARALGPAGLGVFSVLGAVALLAGAVADFGVSNAAVRRIAAVWPADRAAAVARVQSFFWVRIALALTTAVVVGLLAVGPAGTALHLPRDAALIWLAVLGVPATALSGAVTVVQQATGRFGRLSLVFLFNAALTTLLAAALALLGWLTVTTALGVLGIGTSLASFVLARRLLGPGWSLRFPGRATMRMEARHLLGFGVWLWLASLFGLAAARLDLLLVNRWVDPAGVGAYALAANLASKVEIVNHSLYTVLLPVAATLPGGAAVRRYVRDSLFRALVAGLALVPAVALARPAIVLVYGAGFGDLAPLLQGLLVVTLLEILATPLLLLTITADRPRVLAGSEALRAAVLLGAGAWLIPAFGPGGAIAARVIARTTSVAFALALLARRGAAPAPERAGPAAMSGGGEGTGT